MATKLHPLAQEYLNSDQYLHIILKKYKNDPDPIVQALQDIDVAVQERGEGVTAKKIVQKYHDFDLSKTEVNMALIFIRYLSSILLSQGQIQKCQGLLKFAKSLISSSTHSELKLLIDYEYSRVFNSKNDDFTFISKTLPKLIKHSFKAKSLMGAHYMMVGRSGLIKDTKKEIVSLLSAHKVILAAFYDAVERYELEEATTKLASIKKLMTKYSAVEFIKHERWEYILQIFKGSFQPIQDVEILDEEHVNLVNANYYLSINDIDQASHWLSKTPVKEDFESSSFLSYTYVRVALMKRHVKSARSLLNQKTDVYKHYFDDFYYMRVLLLLGDRNNALIYFARLLKNCRKYKNEKMLEYELNLSTEINAADMWHLTQNVNKISSKDIEKLETNIPESHSIQKGVKKIIGDSQQIKSVISKIKQFAKTKNHVLITGETGVGKELVAKALHELSKFNTEPYLAINCGAISESILQSELFGHEAGAYTSADKKHIGIFESAGEGTVFLDEIGDTSPRIQVALLRVLENNEGRPLGATKVRNYSCRILAATNAKLKQQVEAGNFREDLYFRLKSLEIEIPPLRERSQDIETLIQHYFNLDQINDSHPKISSKLMEAFKRYDWPGNVRELKNEVQKMRIMNPEFEFYTIDDSELFKIKPNKINHEEKNEFFSSEEKDDDDLELVINKNSKPYRIKKIKLLFKKYKRLARQEIANTTKSSYKTIGTDLKELITEGFIEKIEPTSSPRTHYFILKQPEI